MDNLTEKELVCKIHQLRGDIVSLDMALKQHKDELDGYEQRLMDLMEAEGKERTAQYDGVGYVSLCAPKVRANVKVENQDAFFQYLRDIGRSDMIKEAVHPKSLATFVKDAIEQGTQLPEFISYFLERNIKLYTK